MQNWLIILSYLFMAAGKSLADVDFFTGDFTANEEDSLFQFNAVEAEPLPTLLAWDLDDLSFPDDGALWDDPLDYTNACTSDSTELSVNLRARGSICEDYEIVKKPRRKKNNPHWFVGSHGISPADMAMPFEEFVCSNRGYRYAVCDSGDPEGVERMFTGLYCSLSHCDLCMLAGEFFFLCCFARAVLLD